MTYWNARAAAGLLFRIRSGWDEPARALLAPLTNPHCWMVLALIALLWMLMTTLN